MLILVVPESLHMEDAICFSLTGLRVRRTWIAIPYLTSPGANGQQVNPHGTEVYRAPPTTARVITVSS